MLQIQKRACLKGMANTRGVVFSLMLVIQVSTCDYIPSWSCDFEHSLCHWLQSTDDQLDFKHVTGDTVSWNDHTTDSRDGKLLYLVDSYRYDRFKDRPGNLMSPVLMPNNGSCMMTLHYKIFQYFTQDQVQVFVNIVTKAPSGSIHRRELFHSQKHDTQSWKRQDVVLQSNVEFQVEITGVIYAESVGKLGIDDVWFSNGCHITEQSPIRLIQLWSSPPYNYPSGILYKNVSDSWSAICSEDSARWACSLLGLKNVLTGNSSSSYQLTSGQTLCLPSNITVPTTKTCNGKSSCTNVTYWECKQEYTSFCPKMTHKACTSAIHNLVCISDDQICDFYNNCPGGEDESDCLAYNRCDFQNGTCDWIAGKHTLYEWKRYFDTSTGQYYLQVDTGKEEAGVALLKFNYTIQGSQNSSCGIRFTFSIRGSLRLLAVSDSRTDVVWSSILSYSRWRRTYVELPSNGTYRILFEAGLKQSYKRNGEFLLANLSFTKHCTFSNYFREYSRNDPSVFVCHSGEAGSRKFVCDFKSDCFDGSDEAKCDQLSGRCNFESSFCDWQVGNDAPEQLRRKETYASRWLTGPPGHRKSKLKNFEPITITSRGKCSAVKRIVNGSSASIFYYGSGVGYCSLSVQTDPRLHISLYAEFFRTGSEKIVLIRAGRDKQEVYGGEFSGSLQPFSLISSNNKLKIRVPPIDGFGSHAFTFNITSTDKPGHAAIYYRPSGLKRIDIVRNCKGSVRRFVFFSPDIVKNETLLPRVTPRMQSDEYYPRERCSFKFVASNGYRLKFFFHIFETEFRYDYLQILNNGIIGHNRFSGKHAPFQFVSKRSSVDMLFCSDSSVQKAGFSLSVVATDENAMPYVPRSNFHSTTTPSVSRPHRHTNLHATAPVLIEKCSKQLSLSRYSRYAWGNHTYGSIYLNIPGSNPNRFVSSSCSWRFFGEKGVKYLLEFSIMTGASSSNSLSVEYGTGKWKTITGIQKFDVTEIGNQFSVILNVTDNDSLKIDLRYSKKPGCYQEAVRSYYEVKYKADSQCYCEGYKYGFLDEYKMCYCGNDSPTSLGYFLQHPAACANCYICEHGLLFVNIHKYNKWLREKEASDSKANSFTIAIAFTVVLCILIFGVCMYFYRKKRASSPRNENVTARADTAENEGNVDPSSHFINASCPEAENAGSIGPSAHFINASCPEGNLPSYEDATRVRLVMPGSRHNSQNTLQAGSDDGQRSLNAAQESSEPPHYNELFQTS